jgi:hypothetical protein
MMRGNLLASLEEYTSVTLLSHLGYRNKKKASNVSCAQFIYTLLLTSDKKYNVQYMLNYNYAMNEEASNSYRQFFPGEGKTEVL